MLAGQPIAVDKKGRRGIEFVVRRLRSAHLSVFGRSRMAATSVTLQIPIALGKDQREIANRDDMRMAGAVHRLGVSRPRRCRGQRSRCPAPTRLERLLGIEVSFTHLLAALNMDYPAPVISRACMKTIACRLMCRGKVVPEDFGRRLPFRASNLQYGKVLDKEPHPGCASAFSARWQRQRGGTLVFRYRVADEVRSMVTEISG